MALMTGHQQETEIKETLISDRQRDYIVQLLPIVGKQRYRELKVEVGIPIETTINKLSMGQASRLIDRMKKETDRP